MGVCSYYEYCYKFTPYAGVPPPLVAPSQHFEDWKLERLMKFHSVVDSEPEEDFQVEEAEEAEEEAEGRRRRVFGSPVWCGVVLDLIPSLCSSDSQLN